MSANQHQQCRREENGDSSYRCADQSHNFVPDKCGADQDRAWSNLSQSDGIDKLLAREPSLFLHYDLLDQGNNNEAAPNNSRLIPARVRNSFTARPASKAKRGTAASGALRANSFTRCLFRTGLFSAVPADKLENGPNDSQPIRPALTMIIKVI